jgi:hypothetical protein
MESWSASVGSCFPWEDLKVKKCREASDDFLLDRRSPRTRIVYDDPAKQQLRVQTPAKRHVTAGFRKVLTETVAALGGGCVKTPH